MALAPLDVWIRLLFAPLAWIEPRYWLRLFSLLFTSTVSTLVTLPERMLVWLYLRLNRFRPDKFPGPVFVLGYYRSGTTHLHYLLECDPQLYTPKWFHVLVPQGFVLSWNLVRLLLIPFMSGSRPMDAMDVGPEFAAEDHFAVNNASGASPLIGKTLLPQAHPHYDRFNELDDLTPAELARWQFHQLEFCRKLALVAGRRRLLLKSPSHTAHVHRLLELFAGVPGVKFVHITRDCEKVHRSNVWMHEIFQRIWNVQPGLPQRDLEDNLLQEYTRSEEAYLRDRDKIPPGCLAEVRIQDLHADPLGQMQRIYRELDLPYSEAFEQRMIEYLDATRNYRPNKHQEWTEEQRTRLAEPLDALRAKLDDGRPPPEKHPVPVPAPRRTWLGEHRRLTGAVTPLLLASICAVAIWFLMKLDPVHAMAWLRASWPAGLIIGHFSRLAAGDGGPRLAVISAALTGVLWLGLGALAAATPGADPATVAANLGRGVLASPFLMFWGALGAISAYRLAARSGR